LRWYNGVIEEISDDTWKIRGKWRKCLKEREVAKVYWDAIPVADIDAERYVEPFAENKWNKNEAGTWGTDLGSAC